MEIDIFKIPQIIQKPIIALLFIQNDYWLKKKTAKTTLPRSMLRSCLQLLVSRQVQGIKGCSVLQIFSKCPPSSRILAVLATVKQVKFCVILY